MLFGSNQCLLFENCISRKVELFVGWKVQHFKVAVKPKREFFFRPGDTICKKYQ